MENGTEGTRFLVCADCGEEFVFTPQAQSYFRERGYQDDPRRCKVCHADHKRRQRADDRGKKRLTVKRGDGESAKPSMTGNGPEPQPNELPARANHSRIERSSLIASDSDRSEN